MKKYIDADKLKAEIERRIDLICTTEGVVQRDRLQEYETLRDVEDFIDSLQQEQEKPKKDCNGCPHCVDRKGQYGWHFKGCFGGPYKGKFIAETDECLLKQEQPEVDLDEETETWISTHIKVETGGIQLVNADELAKTVKEWGKCIARHFYELGLKAKEENK